MSYFHIQLSADIPAFLLVISDKDVTRTDRTHAFFEGENNPNLTVLYDILMTYVMYNFDLGELIKCIAIEYKYVFAIDVHIA